MGRGMELPAVTAIVLAGGISSRMGQDKALMPVDGVPMVRHVWGVAAAWCSVVVVTPWPERYRSVLPENCRFLVEPLPRAGELPPGPLVGLWQGMEAVETDWVLALACDLPRLRGDLIQTGMGQLSGLADEVQALVPWQNQRWEPLCGFYRRGCRVGMGEFVQAGGRSLQRWLAQISVQPWEMEDPTLLFNCNTPGDWELMTSRIPQDGRQID